MTSIRRDRLIVDIPFLSKWFLIFGSLFFEPLFIFPWERKKMLKSTKGLAVSYCSKGFNLHGVDQISLHCGARTASLQANVCVKVALGLRLPRIASRHFLTAECQCFWWSAFINCLGDNVGHLITVISEGKNRARVDCSDEGFFASIISSLQANVCVQVLRSGGYSDCFPAFSDHRMPVFLMVYLHQLPRWQCWPAPSLSLAKKRIELAWVAVTRAPSLP